MRTLSVLSLLIISACGSKEDADTQGSSAVPSGDDTSSTAPQDTSTPADTGDGTSDSGSGDSSSPDSAAPPDTATPDTGSPDTGTEPPPPSDLDGDGFTVEEGDCNDLDSSRHPARPEICDEIDNNCDGVIDEGVVPIWYLDFDGDGHGSEAFTYEGCEPLEGYVDSSDDCDDAAVEAYPGAIELCDGIDNDCNGETDEDVTTTYFLDDDGDGYGDAGFTTDACSAPSFYVDNALDCNDMDSSINPDGTEVCDGADNNCDGVIDEASASDATVFYRDADADTWGTPTYTETACTAPEGFVTNALDCDDHDNDIRPDAVEVCDSEDNDCDGTIDGEASLDAGTFYEDADADSFGSLDSTVTACDAPAGYTSDSTDCDDSSPDVYPGAAEICNGTDDNCDGDIDEAGAEGEVTWYLDLDADGAGAEGAGITSCDIPAGSITTGGDCDDEDGAVYPGAVESCNDTDDDCDGDIDEPGSIGEAVWYIDSDGDGHGDPDSTIMACTAPPGTTDMAGDCDDTSSSAYPGAPEIPDDGIDQDCDGTDMESATHTGSEPGWYHANYDGVIETFNPASGYNGSVSCPTTCAAFGLSPRGMRFVCNVGYGYSGSTEGCTPELEGMYGEENCGLMVRDMVELTENGNTENCTAGYSLTSCVTGICSEGVTWHSIECQCG